MPNSRIFLSILLCAGALALVPGQGAANGLKDKEKDKEKRKEKHYEWTNSDENSSGQRITRPGASETDTTLQVPQGTRLTLENFTGDIDVHAWDKNQVRVQASHSSRTWLEVQNDNGSLSIEAGSRRGFPVSVDYSLTVPAWMGLELSGVNSDISVDGTRGDIKVETVSGDVNVHGGSGVISLSSVSGLVQLTGGSGKIEVSSVNDGASVSTVTGDITADAVNGDLVLDRVESGNVDCSTVNGGIYFSGAFKSDGHYHFDSHEGDIQVGVPAAANVSGKVSTYSGEFHSSFPVTLARTRRGRRGTFTLGSGGADLEVESFQGKVELFRPGEVPVPKLQEKSDDNGSDLDGEKGHKDKDDDDGDE